MWTILLIQALRGFVMPDIQAPIMPSPVAPAGPPAVIAVPEDPSTELTLEEIAQRATIVRDYVNALRESERIVQNLQMTLGANHPHLREARSRAKIMQLRAEEFAARYRQNPKSLTSWQDPEIRRALQAIDNIDIELDLLRPNAGSKHPRVRTLRHYRDLHERRIEKIQWRGVA